jgi:hypothetical protein
MNKIIECLALHKVPVKLIRLVGLTLINTRVKVKINNEYTVEFRVESVVKTRKPSLLQLYLV